MKAWLITVVLTAGTLALKAVGPVLLSGRDLGRRWRKVITLLLPAILSSLVLTGVVDARMDLDARSAGVAAALVALLLRAPLLVVLAVAAVTTAVIRAVL